MLFLSFLSNIGARAFVNCIKYTHTSLTKQCVGIVGTRKLALVLAASVLRNSEIKSSNNTRGTENPLRKKTYNHIENSSKS